VLPLESVNHDRRHFQGSRLLEAECLPEAVEGDLARIAVVRVFLYQIKCSRV
jgi:hypothetical protein